MKAAGSAVSFAALAAALLFQSGTASGSTFKVIHQFCRKADCADGSFTRTGLVVGPDGTLYGTTQDGGALGSDGDRHGTVFSLTPNGDKSRWKYRVLHSFCGKPGCADGSSPRSTLILDTAGNLYGTTVGGGASDVGTAFRLATNAAHTRWKLSVLHSFCPQGLDGCIDGQEPKRPLSYAGAATGAPYDGQSPLFGTTSEGGRFPNEFGGGGGTVYELIPTTAARWKEKVLFNFCSNDGCDPLLGPPETGLFVDSSLNLFGAGADDGTPSDVWELSPNAAKTKWKEKTLYQFCSLASCADGYGPKLDTFLPDSQGNLYGTTYEGGANDFHGTVFKLALHGKRSALTTLYSFCAQASCADGAYPGAGVFIDASGNLFGTTEVGGTANSGTLYKLTSGGSLQVLHSFCAETGCPDGSSPDAGLASDASGILYGTTGSAVYQLIP